MARQPSVKVNGYEVGDHPSRRIVWAETEGLLEATKPTAWSSFETFQGPGRNQGGDMDYPVRRLSIVVRITKQSSFLGKHEALAVLSEIFSGKPAIVQVGSLYLEAEFAPAQVVKDAWKLSAGYLTVRFEGEAIPGTFWGEYGYEKGRAQGIIVQDDRPDHPSLIFTGNTLTVPNPGTAPSEAMAQVTNTSLPNATVYLLGEKGQMVPINLDGTGYGRIDEAWGFLLYPGNNRVRIVDASGALISVGTFATSFYGTRFRHIGNTGNRFADGHVFQHARTGSAAYVGLDGQLRTAGDGEARFGFSRAVGPEGPGLIIERESENLLSANAADFETDVTTDIVLVGPDATPVRTLVPTTLPGASGNALRVETFDTINFRGVRLLAPGYGWATVGPWETITAGVMLRIIQGQVAVALSNGPWLTRTVYGAGDWAFCEVTWRNELGVPASVSIEVCQLNTDVPAIFEVDKAQLELGSLATSWIPGGGRRYADRVGIVPPHNLIPWSTDFSKWAKSGVTIVNPAAQDPQLNYTAALLQKAAVGSPAIWIDSGMACSGRTVTFPIWLAAGTLTTAQLRIMDDTQTVGSNLKTVELVPEWRRYDVTYTFPPGVAGNAQVLLYIDQGNTTPGTIYAWHPNLHLGSTPGIDVPTFDSPILPPPSLALDPAWSQNGEAEFDLELPKLTVGDGFGLFSSMDPNGTGATVALWRYSGTSAASGLLIAERTHNGPSGSGGVGRTQLAVSVDPALFGTRVRFKLAWTHEINEQTGVREMWLKTYVNGALTAQVDVAALYGATAWAPINPSRLISDGNVNAVLSGPDGGIILSYPTPRTGYRQVS